MKKLLIKLFAPSPKTVADGAASGIQKGFNNFANGKEQMLTKYSTIASEAAKVTRVIADMGVDAVIDDKEKEDLAKMLEPLFVKIYEVAGIA